MLSSFCFTKGITSFSVAKILNSRNFLNKNGHNLMRCLFKVKRENKDFQWLVHLARKETLASPVGRENEEIKEKEVLRVYKDHLDILERKAILESLGN